MEPYNAWPSVSWLHPIYVEHVYFDMCRPQQTLTWRCHVLICDPVYHGWSQCGELSALYRRNAIWFCKMCAVGSNVFEHEPLKTSGLRFSDGACQVLLQIIGHRWCGLICLSWLAGKKEGQTRVGFFFLNLLNKFLSWALQWEGGRERETHFALQVPDWMYFLHVGGFYIGVQLMAINDTDAMAAFGHHVTWRDENEKARDELHPELVFAANSPEAMTWTWPGGWPWERYLLPIKWTLMFYMDLWSMMMMMRRGR